MENMKNLKLFLIKIVNICNWNMKIQNKVIYIIDSIKFEEIIGLNIAVMP